MFPVPSNESVSGDGNQESSNAFEIRERPKQNSLI